MDRIKQGAARAWEWLRRWWWTLAIVFGLVAAAEGRRRRIGRVLDQARLDTARREREALEEARARLVRRVDSTDEAIAEVDKALEANARAIVESHANAQGLDAKEVRDAFARLGY